MTRILPSHSSVKNPPEALPAPGDIVGGKYRIERTLGRGGMGAVFEVTHCVTHKRFAIKWLLPHAADSGQAVKRFIREAQIAGRVRHPHVVDVYDIYEEPRGLFLVMELLEGESLEARLKRSGRLRAPEACEILWASMEGIAAAHGAGVVHRDIKPANIFLCQTPGSDVVHPKVFDFGISRLAGVPGLQGFTTTHSGTVIGTPHYMAPEQMRTGVVDVRSDVYALGVTLYEVLSGVRPYDAASYPDLVVKIASGTTTPLEQLAPELPPGLVDVVRRAMAPQPEERFQTVEALMTALRPYAGVAPQPSAAGETPARRFELSLPLAFGLLAALLAAALALVVLWDEPPQSAAPASQLRPAAPPPPMAADVVSPAAPPLPEPAATPVPAATPPAAAPEPARATRKSRPVAEPAPELTVKPPLELSPKLPAAPSEPARDSRPLRREPPFVRLDRDGF